MTDEDLDRYYRHQDTGQHGEDDGEYCPLPPWAIGAALGACCVVFVVVALVWRMWP